MSCYLGLSKVAYNNKNEGAKMNFVKMVIFFVLVTGAFGILSCQESVDDSEEFIGATLPSADPDVLCGETETVEIDDWLFAPDLMVVGVITDLRISELEFVSSTDSGGVVLSDDCKNYFLPALEVDLTITDVIGEETELRELTIHIGADVIGLWNRTPTDSGDREISWTPDDGRSYLSIGEVVGASVYYNESAELWTTAFDPIFSVSDNSVFFQDLGSCSDIPVSDVEGLSIDDFKDIWSDGAVNTDSVEERYSLIRNSIIREPTTSHAGRCHGIVIHPEQSSCNSDADCVSYESDGGFECVEGVCE